MTAAAWVVLVGLGVPVYSYLLYPVVLFCLASAVQTLRDLYYLFSRRERRIKSERVPAVSIIIAAYDEEDYIGRTLSHCLALNYPAGRLEVIVGSDGSRDNTVRTARHYEREGIRVIEFPYRRGKLPVMKDCIERSSGEILVFCDANTILEPDAVARLVRHFDEPDVGAVCGELKFLSEDGELGEEGVYWRYEVILKTLENRLNAVLGANGAIYALRRDLWPEVPDGLITEDFVIPMKVRRQGHRVVYDPEAVATEEPSASLTEELRRKMRIGAGNLQALRHCAGLLMPWRGFVAFSFWSHKVFRWMTPFLLAAALVASFLLAARPGWQLVLVVQLAFYAAATMGGLLRLTRLRSGPLGAAWYFLAVNLALALGLLRGLVRAQKTTWRKAGRRPLTTRDER
ncbi:MAG: glycosyltransferase family 2 protein [Candidatus Brocadiia bacterium]